MNFAVDLQKIAAIENDFKRLGSLNNNYINRELNLMLPDSTNTRTKRRHYISMLARDRTYDSLKYKYSSIPQNKILFSMRRTMSTGIITTCNLQVNVLLLAKYVYPQIKLSKNLVLSIKKNVFCRKSAKSF